MAQVRRASAAMPWRTVSGARSLQAVFSWPEKPNPCQATVRSASVRRRITCETRTSVRQRATLLDLTGDQRRRHLPPAPAAPSTTQLEPLTNVGGAGREGPVEPIAGRRAGGTQEPGSVGASG